MVGERLAEIRKDHDDTQAVLAKKLNVSVTTVRSWEQEKSSPSHDALVAICRLYRISADYLTDQHKNCHCQFYEMFFQHKTPPAYLF